MPSKSTPFGSSVTTSTASEELTVEERVRAASQFVQLAPIGDAVYVYVKTRSQVHQEPLNGKYFYGTTPEEAWNKALLYLITERLKS